MLTTLYPALIEFAESELKRLGRDPDLAQDLVQAASTRWVEVTSTPVAAKRYMRSTIRGLVANLNREGRDAMTRHPLSLDQIEEA